jgi:hypothetical protein
MNITKTTRNWPTVLRSAAYTAINRRGKTNKTYIIPVSLAILNHSLEDICFGLIDAIATSGIVTPKMANTTRIRKK